MATGSAISAPPAVRRPHWTVNSPMKSCNATVTGLPGMYFQGNAGTNTLAFNLVKASTSQIVGLGDGTAGAPDANAEVATTNGTGDTLNVFGSSLAAIQRTGVGPLHPERQQALVEAAVDGDCDLNARVAR